MTKSTRFFRILGRINTVCFFLAFATLAAVFASWEVGELMRSARRAPAPPPPVKTTENVRLEFGPTVDLGPSFTGVELLAHDASTGKTLRSGSFSSGESVEKRNYLLIEATSGASHWLLPDHNHTIVGDTAVTNGDKEGDKAVAHVLLVTPASGAAGAWRVLLTDATMQHVVELATDVDEMKNATLSGSTYSVILGREGKLRLVNADAHTLAKTLDVPINPPAAH